MSITVKLKSVDRKEAQAIISGWCLDNDIEAECDTKQYMSEDNHLGQWITTFWTVPDECQRTLFLLRWS